ncbi:MAG: capsular biosynthesis protein [Rickettsiales bacterium]
MGAIRQGMAALREKVKHMHGEKREKRRFLMLQGPVGPFFRRFARKLLREGHDVACASFNFGDKMFNREGETLVFRRTFSEWEPWLLSLHADRQFTDVIMYNDCRPYHAAAMAALKPLGVTFHLFEEGYFRPNMITYEQNGLNGHSFFYPCSKEKIERNAPPVPCPKAPKIRALPCSLRHIYANAVAYYTLLGGSTPFYPYYRRHRKRPPAIEAWQWIRRLCAQKSARRRSDARVAALPEGKYYLLLLQLSHDTQITRHSRFGGGMRQVIAETVASFAARAPKDCVLAIKNHPLDNGAEDLDGFSARCAADRGVSDRVVFIEFGHLPTMIKASLGAVLVNSTSGTSVLHHGKKLLCLGKAIYDCEGLTFQGSLDDFWTSEFTPNKELFGKLRAAVCAKTQVFGNFYTAAGVECALSRLMRFAPFCRDADAPNASDDYVCFSNASEET